MRGLTTRTRTELVIFLVSQSQEERAKNVVMLVQYFLVQLIITWFTYAGEKMRRAKMK